MAIGHTWTKEPGARVEGSRGLDQAKVQAPCIVRRPEGGFRLFYTAVGPDKPFPACQGYILSAVSDDGIQFEKERGVRFAPQPDIPYVSLRVLAPSVAPIDGGWRMYVEARGPADRPTVVCSATSADQLSWEIEPGVRLECDDARLAGPRFVWLPDGSGQLYCCSKSFAQEDGPNGVVAARTTDGINFEMDPKLVWPAQTCEFDSAGITAAEVVPPQSDKDRWSMVYSVWQEPPSDTPVPLHPADDLNAGEDFATASIASDMSGYRSRIFVTHSDDGREWGDARLCIEGAGYGGSGLDAVHAEDMSVIEISRGQYRMYYAACDRHGNWRVASARSGGEAER